MREPCRVNQCTMDALSAVSSDKTRRKSGNADSSFRDLQGSAVSFITLECD